jgi:flagellin
LSGNFTDKKFQIGAYAGETVDISIQSTEATKIGHITTSDMTFAGAGITELNVYSNLQDKTYSLNSVELAYNNNAENGVGAVADAINKLSDVLGISATASVSSTTDSNIAAGTTDAGFKINGVTIGSLAVSENDSDGALVAAINNKTSEHGVTASVSQDGFLTMTSVDDRAIQVTMGSAATQSVMGGTVDMSTLGKVEVRQEGTSQITITDANVQAGIAVSVADGAITVCGLTSGLNSFSLTAGSSMTSGTLFSSGTVVQGSVTLSTGGITFTSGGINVAGAGSVLLSGSTIGSGTVLTADMTVASGAGTNSVSTVKGGSFLASGTYIESGSMFVGDVTLSLSGTASGSVVFSGGNTYVLCGASVTIGGANLTGDLSLASGSIINADSRLTAGSNIYDDHSTIGNVTLESDMTLGDSSIFLCGTVLKTGSIAGSVEFSGHGNVSDGAMTFTAGSVLADLSIMSNGSTLGSSSGVVLHSDETVAVGQDMLIAGSTTSGTVLNSGSVITAGTVLTNDILDDRNITYAAGTTLEYDITTIGQQNIKEDMILNAGSVLSAGTILGENDAAEADGTESSLSEAEAYRLSDVDVTSQEGAQIGIAVADAALKALDKVRSDLGSVQNQLTSTIANISTTKVNVSAAESTIRDVDFAEESANFTKMQILSQAGTFAMSQANASSQNVLSLLQ